MRVNEYRNAEAAREVAITEKETLRATYRAGLKLRLRGKSKLRDILLALGCQVGEQVPAKRLGCSPRPPLWCPLVCEACWCLLKCLECIFASCQADGLLTSLRIASPLASRMPNSITQNRHGKCRWSPVTNIVWCKSLFGHGLKKVLCTLTLQKLPAILAANMPWVACR